MPQSRNHTVFIESAGAPCFNKIFKQPSESKLTAQLTGGKPESQDATNTAGIRTVVVHKAEQMLFLILTFGGKKLLKLGFVTFFSNPTKKFYFFLTLSFSHQSQTCFERLKRARANALCRSMPDEQPEPPPGT